jgi:hypothetical protein
MSVTIDGDHSSHHQILEQLRGVKEDVVTDLYVHGVNFNGQREQAMIDVFRCVARLDRQIALSMRGCSGSIMGVIVREAFAMDLVSDIAFFGDMGVFSTSIFSELSLGMRFRHLESVQICGRILSREQAVIYG